ncbi:MAG: ABC transporter permease [Actinomycetota bacterium]
MMQKEFRELRRDRRTMAMIVVFPLLLLIIFGYAATFDVDTVSTALVGPGTTQPPAQETGVFDVVIVDPPGTSATAQDLLKDGEVQVAIATDTQPPTAYIDGSSLFTAQAASAALGRLGDQVTVEILYNPDLTTSWVLIPPLIGYILMFIGTVVASIGLVKERENGTLEQLAVMPLSPGSVIFGKVAPYFLVAVIDLVIVTALSMILFDIPFVGNVLLFAAGGAFFLFVVLGVGVLISTVSQNTGQAIQLAIFFLVPQILLSGMIFPLSGVPWAIRWLAYVFPLTYYTVISQGIVLRGAGLESLWPQFVILAAMAAVVFTAAVLRFRRDLTPHRSGSADAEGAEA